MILVNMYLYCCPTTLPLRSPATNDGHTLSWYQLIPNYQNVSVYLMITIQKVTSNVQSVPRQSPDIY
jgi:hypothetical protein